MFSITHGNSKREACFASFVWIFYFDLLKCAHIVRTIWHIILEFQHWFGEHFSLFQQQQLNMLVHRIVNNALHNHNQLSFQSSTIGIEIFVEFCIISNQQFHCVCVCDIIIFPINYSMTSVKDTCN